jgi:hypothetical protein
VRTSSNQLSTARNSPPTSPASGPPVVLNRTSLGLATGGIQLSQQAVPTAVESAINSGPGLCKPAIAVDTGAADRETRLHGALGRMSLR